MFSSLIRTPSEIATEQVRMRTGGMEFDERFNNVPREGGMGLPSTQPTLGGGMSNFGRLSEDYQTRKLQSEFSALPQMEALRGGIMSRMAGSLGIVLPKPAQQNQNATSYAPSWMRSSNVPQFPMF